MAQRIGLTSQDVNFAANAFVFALRSIRPRVVSAWMAKYSAWKESHLARRLPRTCECARSPDYAEPVIGPAEGRTRWRNPGEERRGVSRSLSSLPGDRRHRHRGTLRPGHAATYVVVAIRKINDADTFKSGVVDKATAAITAGGGHFVIRTDKISDLDGQPPQRFVLIQFDSPDNTHACHVSELGKTMRRARRARSRCRFSSRGWRSK
jgi:uncharacterized protein (DUF1330 family)